MLPAPFRPLSSERENAVHSTLRTAAAIFGLFASVLPLGAVAAQPNGRDADEQLVISVISTKIITKDGVPTLKALAKVTDVTKSKAGLKAGDQITVVYVAPRDVAYRNAAISPQSGRRPSGGCGSFTPPALITIVAKRRYHAYLQKSADGTFTLGARYNSFQAM